MLQPFLEPVILSTNRHGRHVSQAFLRLTGGSSFSYNRLISMTHVKHIMRYHIQYHINDITFDIIFRRDSGLPSKMESVTASIFKDHDTQVNHFEPLDNPLTSLQNVLHESSCIIRAHYCHPLDLFVSINILVSVLTL